MLSGLMRVFSVPELRKKIFFTFLMLVVCRIGAYIPVPGIHGDAAVELFRQATGGGQNLFQLMDVFSGGAFAQMTIIALGVMPYISASIVMQLMMAIIPSLQREIKENPEMGRRKLNKWTRLLTIGLAAFQAAIFGKYAVSMNAGNPGIIVDAILAPQIGGLPWLFFLIVIMTMTAGTMFLMWIGEQITEKGVGNGVSLIITLGILSSLPTTIGVIVRNLNFDSQEIGQISFPALFVLMALFVCIIVGTILVIQGQRKIPLQYARRVVGRHEVQGGRAYIPLKVNYAGVIPVIFASSILMFPATIGQFAGPDSWMNHFAKWLAPGAPIYSILFVFFIIFFTYFWTATQFHPEQIASDMKKNGAFIPGIRQGRPTQDYLEETMSRITFAGALFLAAIAVLPTIISKLLKVDANISYFFGGTSLLILVGVVLDTSKQIESHMLMKRYEGFMKKGRLRRQ